MSGVVIYAYLNEMVKKEATDLYLTVGVPPTIRIDDRLQALSDIVMQVEDLQTLLGERLTSRQRLEFDTNMELNLALDMGKEAEVLEPLAKAYLQEGDSYFSAKKFHLAQINYEAGLRYKPDATENENKRISALAKLRKK